MMASNTTQDPTAPGTSDIGSSAPSTGSNGHDAASGRGPSPADALKSVRAHVAELKDYVSYFLAAKVDGIKVSLRNLGILAALGVVGLIAGGTFVATSVVLVCVGVAAALTRLFGDRLWAGTLVTGILFLGLLAGGILLGMKMLARASRERTVQKYASRQSQQRVNFGSDVAERASEPARPR